MLENLLVYGVLALVAVMVISWICRFVRGSVDASGCEGGFCGSCTCGRSESEPRDDHAPAKGH